MVWVMLLNVRRRNITPTIHYTDNNIECYYTASNWICGYMTTRWVMSCCANSVIKQHNCDCNMTLKRVIYKKQLQTITQSCHTYVYHQYKIYLFIILPLKFVIYWSNKRVCLI